MEKDGFWDERRAELLVLLVFLEVVFLLRVAVVWEYRLAHSYPQPYLANDNFFHYLYSEHIKEAGEFRYSPPHMAAGYEDVVGYAPPILYHLSAMLSIITGLETYDSVYLVAMLLFSFGCVLLYFAIRRFDRNVALLSLPFMLGLYARVPLKHVLPFEIPFLWGQWLFLTGSFFLLALVWCLPRLDSRRGYLLLALFLSGMALAHTSELFFGIGLLGAYLLYVRYTTGKFSEKTSRNLKLGGAIALAVSIYYLIIFKFTWWDRYPYPYGIVSDPRPLIRGVYLSYFDPVQLAAVLGGIALSLNALKKGLKPEQSGAIIAGLFLLAIGFSNYLGGGLRAFQIRMLWPVYLSVFGGMSVWYLIKRAGWKWKYSKTAVLALALIAVFGATHIAHVRYLNLYLYTDPLIDPYNWDGIKWIQENTSGDARIGFFFPFGGQDMVMLSSGRPSYKHIAANQTGEFSHGTIAEGLALKLLYVEDTSLPYRKGMLSYRYHAEEEDLSSRKVSALLAMDYYYFNKPYPNLVQQEDLITDNVMLRALLLKDPFIREVYSNEVVSILKNERPEGR